MNGGEARNGMVEQKFVSVMYSGLEGPPIFTDCLAHFQLATWAIFHCMMCLHY